MQAFPSESRTGRTPDGLVVALRPLGAASPYRAAWRALSRKALCENLFFEPDFALAAAETFGAGVGLLTVCDREPDAPGMRLLALWPCRIVHRWGVPLPALMGWTHGFSIFGAPLLDPDEPLRAAGALLDAPRSLGLPRRLLMPYLPLDGPLAARLEQARAARASRRVDFWTHERGFLDLAGADAAARAGYLAAHLSKGKARQLARLHRRLAAKGPPAFETLRAPQDLREALDDYIALEAAGWKGRAGTAIGQHPEEAAFLRRLIGAYGAKGAVRIDRLRRNGRSLAASIGLRTGSTYWYLKIAHTEDEARNSPGAQLVRQVTESLLADASIVAADSCAPPGFALIEGFWGERRRLAHALIEAGGGDPLFPLAARLERLRARMALMARTRRRRTQRRTAHTGLR